MNYFLSKNIKVFPCTYRGSYGDQAFDPESRLVSEYNYTHLPGIVNGKKSYIVDCTATSTTIGMLKCVIDGYYFEISNIMLEKFLTLYISVSSTELVVEGRDTRRDLHYLSVINIESYNFADTTSTALDNQGVTTLAEDKFEYYFRGLAYSTESSPAGSVKPTATLQITDSSGNLIPENDIRNFGALYVGTDPNKTARRTSMTAIASKANQVALGEYNQEDQDAVFIVGDGTEAARHNVLVAKSGKVVVDQTLEAKNIIVESLKVQGSDIIETSVGTVERVTTLEANVNGLTQTIAETKTELGNTSSTVSTLTHDITGLKTAVQNTQTDISGVTETLTQFSVENGKINTSIESLTTRADGADKKFSTLNQTIDGFKTQVSSAQTNATSALTKTSTFEQTVDEFRTEVNSKFSSVDGKIEEARSSFEQTVEGFKTEVNKRVETLDGTISEAKTQFAETAEGITGRMETIESNTDTLTRRVGDLEVTAGGITAEFIEEKVEGGISKSKKILDIEANVDTVYTNLTRIEGETVKTSTFEQTVEGLTASIEQVGESVDGKVTAKVAEYKATVDGFSTRLSAVEDGTVKTSTFEQTVGGILGRVDSLEDSASASFQLTEEAFNIKIKEAVQAGAERVYTSEKNYSFDNAGLNISSSDNSLSTVIDEDGMDISRNGQLVLVANNEGVRAEDLHATTYLIIGANSRLENFTNEAGNTRTACFWIGD
jgi:predicted  nucleic acid-binding Zn-ribbon protein